MTVLFIDAASADTGNSTFPFWDAITGAVTSSSTTVHAPSVYSIKLDANSAPATLGKSSILNDAGRRVSVYMNGTTGLTNSGEPWQVLDFQDDLANSVFDVRLTPTALIIESGAPNVTTAVVGVSGQWHRISVAYVITTTTNFTIKVWFDGVLTLTATNADFTLQRTGTLSLTLGIGSTNTDRLWYASDIYVDDGNTLDDQGDIRVTAKQAAALNTNNFSTLGGSGTNRYDRVSDRPLSLTNYIAHTTGTDVQENFQLPIYTADANLSRARVLARLAWVHAKRGPIISAAPKLTGSSAFNATGTTVTASFSGTVNAGDIVVFAVADQMTSTVTITVSDSVGGNTWTQLSGPTTNTIRASKWYCIVTNGGVNFTVTATFTSQNASRAAVGCVWDSHSFAATPLDKNVTNANDSTTPFTCPLSGVLAQANEIVLGFTFSAGNTVFTATSPNLLGATVASSGGSAATNSAVAIGYQAVSATTSIAPVFAGTSRTSVQSTASFKYDPTANRSAGTPKLMDNGSESSVVLTETAAFYSSFTSGGSYPSNVAGIGMRSSGAAGCDTYFYEGGMVIAYIPSSAVISKFVKQAVNRASTY